MAQAVREWPKHAYRRRRQKEQLAAALALCKEQRIRLAAVANDDHSLELDQRLEAIKPCVQAQLVAASEGKTYHSARNLVDRDTYSLRNAAVHNFERQFKEISPAIARHMQRRTRRSQSSSELSEDKEVTGFSSRDDGDSSRRAEQSHASEVGPSTAVQSTATCPGCQLFFTLHQPYQYVISADESGVAGDNNFHFQFQPETDHYGISSNMCDHCDDPVTEPDDRVEQSPLDQNLFAGVAATGDMVGTSSQEQQEQQSMMLFHEEMQAAAPACDDRVAFTMQTDLETVTDFLAMPPKEVTTLSNVFTILHCKWKGILLERWKQLGEPTQAAEKPPIVPTTSRRGMKQKQRRQKQKDKEKEKEKASDSIFNVESSSPPPQATGSRPARNTDLAKARRIHKAGGHDWGDGVPLWRQRLQVIA